MASKVAVSATSLPWEALRVSLSQSFYGGRIDNKFDQVFFFTLHVYFHSHSLSNVHAGCP